MPFAKDWGPLRKTPLELIDAQIEYDYNEPLVYKELLTLCGIGLGAGLNIWVNIWSKRPVFSGIQKTIAYAAIGGVGFHFFNKRRLGYLAEKNAVIRHYIQTHPEDFVQPARKKYADILEVWYPIR